MQRKSSTVFTGYSAIFGVVAIAMVLPAAASEPTRQLGAHEHGHGFLDIAIEGGKVSLELQVPGSDVALGKAKGEKARKVALAQLRKPLDLFKFPAAAGCKVERAAVRVTVVGENDHEHEKSHGHKETGHDDHAKGKDVSKQAKSSHDHDDHANESKAKSEAHAHKDHAKDAHSGHTDYHGVYRLACASPARLGVLELPYFKVFPKAGKLTVQMIGPKGQTKAEATRKRSRVSLDGAI